MASRAAALVLKAAVFAVVLSMLVLPSSGRCTSLGPAPPPPPLAPVSATPEPPPPSGPKITCADCMQCGDSCSSDCSALSCLPE
ncbi:hypothetical protein CFC21_013022 [Triticum aestivum]|uniref:4Fe-4S ferredoxin-type domain-containing protein n=2 Tax=Triticum aestivum TaxID=4565 RepID=A0A9R1DRI5_WHEAT|nr:hypothetical protein CFC21_013019 [Triticum aestivum]KAF6996712.1 hypothetical protein CFC21_013022 [Triticum aestivum]